MKIGFIQTFFGVCSGTEIFSDLKSTPFHRAIWHLFILSIFCGLINVSFQLHPFNKGFEEFSATLAKKFGEIELSSNGLVPTKNSDTPSFAVYEDFRVDYLLSSDDLKLYEPNSEYYKGVVWTPDSLLFWFKYADTEEYSILPLLLPVNNLKTPSEMYALFEKASKKDSIQPFYILSEMYTISDNDNITPTPFREFELNIFMWIPLSIPILFSIYLFLSTFANIMALSFLYLLVFSIFSSIFGKSSMLNLSFAKTFMISIYVAFPGAIIATLYTALKLPYFSFQTIFLISYFIYSIPVFARLQRENIEKLNS